MHEWVEKTVLLPAQHPFLVGKPFPQSGQAFSSLVPIASSLMGGCGLSDEHVEDDYKSTCVEFGG